MAPFGRPAGEGVPFVGREDARGRQEGGERGIGLRAGALLAEEQAQAGDRDAHLTGALAARMEQSAAPGVAFAFVQELQRVFAHLAQRRGAGLFKRVGGISEVELVGVWLAEEVELPRLPR